jgi:hypothetical protein
MQEKPGWKSRMRRIARAAKREVEVYRLVPKQVIDDCRQRVDGSRR